MKKWDYNLNLEFDKYQGIKNWLKYRSCDLDYDCDVSKYAMDVYKGKYKFLSTGIVQLQYSNFPSFQKWNKDNLKWEIQINNTIYSGDTLNSFATPFNRFVNAFISKLNNKKFKTTYISKNSYKLLLDEIDIIFSDYNLSQVEYSSEIIMYFDKFANLTHTIGNLFPVPLYFNKERAMNGDYEFPDILLSSIYEYYLSEDSNKREVGIRVIENKKKIEKTVNWLDSFGKGKTGWDKFISVYRFSMYLDEKSEPIKLWNKHDIDESLNTPDIGKEFLKYLRFVCESIEKRGNEILSRVSEDIGKSDR